MSALFAVIVKLHVLVAHAAADPVPAEKIPGVDGAGEFAESLRAVPEGMEKTHDVLGATGLQTYPSGEMPVAPVFGPWCVIVRFTMAAVGVNASRSL